MSDLPTKLPKNDPKIGDLDYELKKHENWKLTSRI